MDIEKSLIFAIKNNFAFTMGICRISKKFTSWIQFGNLVFLPVTFCLIKNLRFVKEVATSAQNVKHE